MNIHEETLEIARSLIHKDPSLKDWVVSKFPELKESEDEIIRKELIEFVKSRGGFKQEYIDFLEKQGEHKPEIKYIYPKFRVGDVIEPAKPNGSYIPVRVKCIGKGGYYCESDDRKAVSSIPICNENEYVLTEQKPTWSEEEENLFDLLSACVCYYINDPNLEYSKREKVSKEIVPFIEMLKSLKPQTHWKPSEEQMDYLKKVYESYYFCDGERSALESLYNDLKKL